MLNWILTHLSVFSTAAQIGTLLVWFFYAHLLYKSFHRNERPLILIHQAQGSSIGSSCIVANLGREPLHVTAVDLILHTDDHEVVLHLNDYRRITGGEESDWAVEDVMKEGPLRSGDFLSLGGFRSMLDACRTGEHTAGSGERHSYSELADRATELEIRVTALYSAFDYPIGALRRFQVKSDDGEVVYLIPKTPITRQLNSYRERRRVYRWLRNRQEHKAEQQS